MVHTTARLLEPNAHFAELSAQRLGRGETARLVVLVPQLIGTIIKAKHFPAHKFFIIQLGIGEKFAAFF